MSLWFDKRSTELTPRAHHERSLNTLEELVINNFPERRVQEIWQDYLPGRTDLVTEENEPVEIVYPGRPNDDRGADLRDAIIATRRGRLKGDIEIHVKSSGWWAHHHHRDPAYNRVILHVVFWNDTAAAVVLQNGHKVPTLALHKFIEVPGDRSVSPVYPSVITPMPCRSTVHHWDSSFTGGVLEEAGEQRFLSRVEGFQEAFSRDGVGQTLYEGIMAALGYARNKDAMAELARRMPLHRLEAAASAGMPGAECLAGYQARLMGMAGLLPSPQAGWRPTDKIADVWVDKLEKAWVDGGETAAMSAADWRFFKVRPGNYPSRRIAAMSYLLLRYRKPGLQVGLMNSLDEVAVEGEYRCLEECLLVAAADYWGRYLDFGLPAGRVVPALLGRERAADIVVNVLLPLAAARGRAGAHPELSEKAFDIYHRYPALAENTIEKHMRRQLGLGRYLVNTASRQQGLLHIYKTRCSEGKCRGCPMSQER
jgi:hypothetical protein